MANETATPEKKPACPICIRCGNVDATVRLDLDGSGTFRCSECEEEYDVADVRAVLESWRKILAWVETYPSED